MRRAPLAPVRGSRSVQNPCEEIFLGDPDAVTTKELFELRAQIDRHGVESLTPYQRGRVDLAIEQMMALPPTDEEVAAAIWSACRVNEATA